MCVNKSQLNDHEMSFKPIFNAVIHIPKCRRERAKKATEAETDRQRHQGDWFGGILKDRDDPRGRGGRVVGVGLDGSGG